GGRTVAGCRAAWLRSRLFVPGARAFPPEGGWCSVVRTSGPVKGVEFLLFIDEGGHFWSAVPKGTSASGPCWGTRGRGPPLGRGTFRPGHGLAGGRRGVIGQMTFRDRVGGSSRPNYCPQRWVISPVHHDSGFVSLPWSNRGKSPVVRLGAKR